MKKLFLLTSIILFTFGFSLNSNVIHSSNKNGNNSDIIDTSQPKSPETFYFTMDWLGDADKRRADIILTPSTATVGYQFNSPYDMKTTGISWLINGSYDDELCSWSESELENMGQHTVDTDVKQHYEGNLTAKKLEENHDYSNSFLKSGAINLGDKRTDEFKFTTPTLNTKANNFIIDESDVETTNDTAIITFDFTPSSGDYKYWYRNSNGDFMVDNDGYDEKNKTGENSIPPVKAEWVKGDDLLGSTTNFGNNKDGTYNATITIDENSYENIGANQEFDDTKIIIYDEFATYEPNPEEYTYESNEFSFTTKDEANIETEINKAKVVDIGGEEATLNYEIDPGTDENGDDLEIHEISWEDNGSSGKKFPPVAELTPEEPNNDGIVVGSLTNDNLKGFTDYQTKLKVTLKDKNGDPYGYSEKENIDFTTKDYIEDGTIEVIGITEDGTLENNNKNEQTIRYRITPQEINYEPVDPERIEFWSDNQLIETNDHPVAGKSTAWEITGLTAGTTYENNVLKVYDSSSSYCSTETFKFTTMDGADVGKVTAGEEGNNEVAKRTETSATIEYNIKPALNSIEDEINPTKITWVDNEGNELGKKAGDASIVDTENDPLKLNDNITANNLTPGTPYENTYLIVEDGTSEDYTSKDQNDNNRIEEFQTEDGDSLGIVKSDSEAIVNEDEKTTATVGYTITPAKNTKAEDIPPESITWVDNDGKELGDGGEIVGHEPSDSIPLTGQIKVSGLKLGVTYSSTYLKVNDGTSSSYNSKDSYDGAETINPFTAGSYKAPGNVTSSQEILPIKGTSNMKVDYKIEPALNDNGDSNTIKKITWVDNGGKELGETPGDASITNPKIPSPDKNGIVKGDITANLAPNSSYENTYLVVEDNKNGEYNKCEIGDFNNKDVNRQGTVEGEIKESPAQDPEDVNSTHAKVGYTIIEGTLSNGLPNYATKITWYGMVNGKKTELASDENPIVNEEDFGDSVNEVGILEAENLTPGTKYKDTYLVVEQMEGEPYNSAVMESNISTPPADEVGEISAVGEPIAKGDSATITYAITPAKDEHGDNIKTTNVKWIAKVKDPDSTGGTKDILLAEEPPDSFDGGTLTAYNLPTNITYEETYLVMEGNFVTKGPDHSNKHYESTSSIKLDTGNFKTKKMIIGGSALGIVVIIFAIISFFAWGWIKRRKVN